MTNYAPAPDAADVLGGLITDGEGDPLGFDAPADDASQDFGDEHANYGVPRTLAEGEDAGELMYERTDANTGETTFGVRNTSRSKIRNRGKTVEPYVMIWKLTDEIAVRAPTNQVIRLLKLRDEKNRKVFALKPPENIRPRQFPCLFAEDAGCDARFKDRSQQLRHAQKRHPALWEAKTIGNEQAQVDSMTALVRQNQEAMQLLLASNERQAQVQNALIEKLLASGGSLPTAAEVASAPSRPVSRAVDLLDAAPRVPSPIEPEDEEPEDEEDEEASEIQQDGQDEAEDEEEERVSVQAPPTPVRPGGRRRGRS